MAILLLLLSVAQVPALVDCKEGMEQIKGRQQAAAEVLQAQVPTAKHQHIPQK